ncbi:putative type I restriction enzymeP M protein [Thalassoglobus neptunius]|uniref:site-specific DNA-methyltransferase (adenine-specific) n=1 Tax=Thalassoglobus neptunius TaxID=1938619 RepID=A0A5C5VR85_9PLAN|nr:class I SAM-dependent DNA methyltransferase [Thalassoglobus neptunius]TWT40199.1 putative type I restriction enzymeP M protein [Thalassoglobus neptunius]
MTNHITQSQLESYLWGAATLLRGYIDAGDYKQFIFPLLFFKRMCDVYDEEYAAALEESGGDEDFASFAENHRFVIPEDAHWNVVRETGKNVGKAIQDAMRKIESANTDKLYGIFGDAQWTNKDRLPDRTLKELIEHFSSQTLSITNCPEDELGVGYEYLIKKFADDSGHTAAEFYTNRTVVHLMTELLQPQPGESVYDPTCGSGGMLLSCVTHLRRQNKEWRTLKLFGQERNLMTSAIARMNCFLHGIEDFQIQRADTLGNPQFVSGDRLQQFDVCLANPPYSIKQWDRAAFSADPWGRNIYGTPPSGCADYAFFQHIVCSLSRPRGRCAILFPHGVLFRDAERSMREKLVSSDLVECVVGLGPNLFYNSPMEACIVICRTQKERKLRNKILFINAVNEVTRESAQSFLRDSHIRRIADAYHKFHDVENFASVRPRDDVRENGYDLRLHYYVRPPEGNQVLATSDEQLPEAVSTWRLASSELRASMSTLFERFEDKRLG